RADAVVEEDEVAGFHLLEVVARLVIPDAGPVGFPVADEIVPRIRVRFLFHEPVLHEGQSRRWKSEDKLGLRGANRNRAREARRGFLLCAGRGRGVATGGWQALAQLAPRRGMRWRSFSGFGNSVTLRRMWWRRF